LPLKTTKNAREVRTLAIMRCASVDRRSFAAPTALDLRAQQMY
jgi:hypothetical protein